MIVGMHDADFERVEIDAHEVRVQAREAESTTSFVAHKPWATCVSDAVTACGVDAATVVAVWGAHVNAEAREGFTPIALISEVPQSK